MAGEDKTLKMEPLQPNEDASEAGDYEEDEIRHLKKKRAGFKSVITRLKNKIDVMLQSEETNIGIVKDALHDVAKTATKFKECYYGMCALLTSSQELAEAKDYYQKEALRIEQLKYNITQWIQSVEGQEMLDDLGESASQASQAHSNRTSVSSMTRIKQIDATANRKALEAKYSLLEQQQLIIERKFHLQHEEMKLNKEQELLSVVSEVQQAIAKEKVYVEANVAEQARHTSRQSSVCNNSIVNARINSQNVQDNNNVSYFAQIIKQQEQNTLALTLPTPEVPTFDGSAIDYCSFIRAFDSLIECRTTSSSSKLYYLVQYTKGDVQDLMKSCLSMDPDAGYKEARTLLKKRYGQDYKVATAYIDQITKCSPIKSDDRTSLQRYSVLLTCCLNTLKSINGINQIQSADSLRAVIDKLPYDMRRRWRTKADIISEVDEREIQFEDIVHFVAKEARVVSHPVFGSISGAKGSQSQVEKKHVEFRAKKSYATKIDSSSVETKDALKVTENKSSTQLSAPPTSMRNCIICNMTGHTLENCVKFKNMDISSRCAVVKSKGLCMNCLVPHHMARDCKKWTKCVVCDRKHHTLLHQDVIMNNNNDKHVHVGAVVGGSECIGLPIIPIKVLSQDGELIITNAFLDNGSNMTFCTEELKAQVGLSGKKTRFSLSTLDRSNHQVEGELLSIQLTDINEEVDPIELSTVICRPSLPISKEDIAGSEDLKRWKHLQNISLSTYDGPIGILIGNDNASLLEPHEVIRSQHDGPYAVKTVLGWTVNGPLGRTCTKKNVKSHFIDVELNTQFKQYCNEEFQESLADTRTCMSQDDIQAKNIMDATTHKSDGHYVIDLPLKSGDGLLPNNKFVAEHRLRLLKKRLQRDEKMHQNYIKFMNNLFVNNYAEVVYDHEEPNQVWYLPHHPVVHSKKPEKVRIVFDCSAKYKNVCLNDALLQGPNFNNTLIGVLLRFRKAPIAMTSDVEAMFHQVHVTPHHRDLLRFLWWKDGNLAEQPQICRMKVHIFGATSSPSCCSYALKRTADDNLNEFSLLSTTTVKENFYVDDCLVSVNDDNTAIDLYNDLSKLLASGGFHLTKWSSNSAKVMKSIPEEERANGMKEIDIGNISSPVIERTLGVLWDIQSDTFRFQVLIKERPATRRGLLSMMSSVYDPLGFISPILLPVKIILQDLCKQGFKWDDIIPEEYLVKWKRWLFDLPKLQNFSIHRCIKPSVSDIITCELHSFCDASEVGYGVVVYVRSVRVNGDNHVRFLIGKSRAAPLKSISIPRLELAAAALSVKLDHMIRRELQIDITRSVFWTDSSAVLKYINNKDKRFKTFVANRIGIIRDGSEVSAWRYIPSMLNPADDASRGLDVSSIIGYSRWSMGPGFLLLSQEKWPEPLPSEQHKLDSDDSEVKCCVAKVTCTIAENEPTHMASNMLKRFSSWSRMKKCVAWILRYIRALKKAVKLKDTSPCNSLEKITCKSIDKLDIDEINDAEKQILILVQEDSFREELKNEGRVKKSSVIYRLDPIWSNELLRIGGRIKNAPIPDSSKHPVILPQKHHVSDLIIRHYHSCAGHSGASYVLSLIRQQYWIIHGKAAVRRVLAKCVDCRRRQGKVGEQKMGDLPPDRTQPCEPPFTSIGIDFFGPFYVKRGRSLAKRYGCIFTCLSMRAVHIEIAHSLDTDSFLQCMRRFIARRGMPKIVRSDNGGNFVSGEKELRTAINDWNQKNIDNFFLQRNIRWIFNPPTGSHHGGAWERCIRTIRKILNALLTEQTPDDEGLVTLMCEVESIINGRPLTTISDDPRDENPITPNHLLLLHANSVLPPGVFTKTDTYSRKRWRHIQYLADQFWGRWLREYLPLLQTRQKWNKGRRNFKIGDIVLLSQQNTPRNSWPLGKIVETLDGKDGRVRIVKVLTRGMVLDRPITKCVFLEGDTDDSIS